MRQFNSYGLAMGITEFVITFETRVKGQAIRMMNEVYSPDIMQFKD